MSAAKWVGIGAAVVGIGFAIRMASRGCERAPENPSVASSSSAIDRWTNDPRTTPRAAGERLVFHDVQIDERGKLLPAIGAQSPYHAIVTTGFRALAEFDNGEHGHKPYFTASMFEPKSARALAPGGWLHNPPGLAAMLVRGAVAYYAYSGDRRPLEDARAFVDYILREGLSGVGDSYGGVPFASAHGGELQFRGGDDKVYCEGHDACGRGDGRGFLEPDKIGEFGHALALLHEATGEKRYLERAIHMADVLASHVRDGDRTHSPWPFRVDAKTGNNIREEYSSNIVFTIDLFDRLSHVGAGRSPHVAARDEALKWLREYPLRNQLWQGFFEDIPIHKTPGSNPNQYSAGETARWLMRRSRRDPSFRAEAQAIIDWIAATFAVDVDSESGKTSGHFYGAEAISEQKADMAKMGSHTARFASILALFYELTGDASARERARLSFNWATYCMRNDGIVKVGPDDKEGYWFSDGYGDYLPHFIEGMAAVPAWAPNDENHMLRASSVVTRIDYSAGRVEYETFDANGEEELRVTQAPLSVVFGDGKPANAEVKPMAVGAFVRITRNGQKRVRLSF